MDSCLLESRPDRPRWALVGSSAVVHGLVIALLLLISGPVWKAERKRVVTALVVPVRMNPVRPRVVPHVALVVIPAVVAPRSLSLPAPRVRPTVRIEAPAEVSLVTAIPVLAAPVLAVKPAVQVGMLDSPGLAMGSKRLATASAGFEVGAVSERSGSGRQLGQTGFDDGSGTGGVAAKRQFARGGFDDAEAPAGRSVAKAVPAAFEGIEILEKPQPAYTEEARRLRIEGTVQLRVVFGASGELRVVSVVKGLGHGLDEAAMQAARAIRFRPARRDGHPVDAPAVIQIQFQIA